MSRATLELLTTKNDGEDVMMTLGSRELKIAIRSGGFYAGYSTLDELVKSIDDKLFPFSSRKEVEEWIQGRLSSQKRNKDTFYSSPINALVS